MKTTTTNTTKKSAAKDISKEVLFQRIGNTWFVFTENNGEMVYSVMPEGMDPKTTKLELYQIIEEHMQRVANHQSRRTAEAV